MAGKTGKQPPQGDEDAVPGPVRPEVLIEELRIMRFVENETHDEKVQSLKKVKTEQVFDARMDIWDVRTGKNRYWVITNPANLYSQDLFASYDYALTFHVGRSYRNASNHLNEDAEKEQDQLAVPWRHWEHAVVSLDRAAEVEEFQAVGILCRVCLLSLVKAVISDEVVAVDPDRPVEADFIHWSAYIADSIAPEPGAEEVRSYLKTISKAAWDYVNWLPHAGGAARPDARLAVEAAEYVLMAFGAALLRRDQREP